MTDIERPMAKHVLFARLEFENARLDRLVDRSNQAMRQGKSVEAASLMAEAKQVRSGIDQLEALLESFPKTDDVG